MQKNSFFSESVQNFRPWRIFTVFADFTSKFGTHVWKKWKKSRKTSNFVFTWAQKKPLEGLPEEDENIFFSNQNKILNS
jgi:hypothetical protein